MRRLLLLLALAATCASSQARNAAIQCESTADCGPGETCVAGDSVAAIQQCVAGAVCGGDAFGGCPSDSDSGQLACIPLDGVYKCLSITRCDDYFGAACSAGCAAGNGEQCGGNGACQMEGTTADGSPSFSCACNSGFTGKTCDSGSDSASVSESASTSASASASSSGSLSSLNSSDSGSHSSASTSTSSSSSIDASSSSSSREGSGAANNVAGSAASDDNPIASESSSEGSGSTVVIIVAILAAVVLVGAIAFALYARKKRKQKDLEPDDGFSRADTGSDPDAMAGGGADTPKHNIVTM